MNWRMVMAILHSNGQQRTEKDGHAEKGCHKPVVRTAEDYTDDRIHTTHGILVIDPLSIFMSPPLIGGALSYAFV